MTNPNQTNPNNVGLLDNVKENKFKVLAGIAGVTLVSKIIAKFSKLILFGTSLAALGTFLQTDTGSGIVKKIRDR